MRHDTECLPGVSHLAVLNMFRETDGTVQITIAMADGAMIEWNSGRAAREMNLPLYAKPIDYVEELIIEAADNMRARRNVEAQPETFGR